MSSTTGRSAVVFPGQGAYYPGALGELRDQYPHIDNVFDEVDRAAESILGGPVAKDLFSAARDIDALLLEAPTALQLAIYGTSVATYQVLASHGLRPDVHVGHSLGEIASLVCAGAWTVHEGAEIVCHRSLALQERSEQGAGMAAVGLDSSRAEHLIAMVGEDHAVVAVRNHDQQTVITGTHEALAQIQAVAKGLRVMFAAIRSPYPFHSPWVLGAAADFRARLGDAYPSAELQVPVYSPIEQRRYTDEDDLAELISSQLTRSVDFAGSVRTINDDGVGVFVECGALGGLSGIISTVLAEREIVAVTPLLPDPGEATTLKASVAELGRVGAVSVGADLDLSSVASLLLPGTPPNDMMMFWADRGPDVVASAQSIFGDWNELTRDQRRLVNGAEPGTDLGPVLIADDEVGEGSSRRAEVFARVVQVYAEALEYPPEVLEADTDLESELGVDSVKQTELLA
ncbi:MAG: acyltransferase domain-containing protein, partial [Ornithinimicrobium sp.]